MGNLTACDDVVIWAIDLKRGMELRPWASCIARLATTPAEAEPCSLMPSRSWRPGPRRSRRAASASGSRRQRTPALVIIVDEYAELAEAAPAAVADADSIARRGRAVAVTLVAATQRPTQKAMGQGALRSQMDVRMSFRVRERKDVDLILGQGMLAAGWHAHTLNAPGKFLISAPEHDTPRRARCYLVTDEAVASCRRSPRGHTGQPWTPCPSLPSASEPRRAQTSRGVRRARRRGQRPGTSRPATGTRRGRCCGHALSLAPPEGTTRARADGGDRHEPPVGLPAPRGPGPAAGQVIQVSRGRWRALPDGSGNRLRLRLPRVCT